MPMKWFCYNGLEPSEPNYLTSKSKLKKLAGSKHVMRAVTVRPNQTWQPPALVSVNRLTSPLLSFLNSHNAHSNQQLPLSLSLSLSKLHSLVLYFWSPSSNVAIILLTALVAGSTAFIAKHIFTNHYSQIEKCEEEENLQECTPAATALFDSSLVTDELCFCLWTSIFFVVFFSNWNLPLILQCIWWCFVK